ncbi:MAG: PD-(D/E)XK nuclease family protein [Candidatus Lindowbacteria bacterium]|nr:PD-(D/E)XK nuclease family protein [Candidatus Lindowbacteria bacterium]
MASDESVVGEWGRGASIYDVMKGMPGLLDIFRPETRDRLRTLVGIIDRLANERWALTIGELISETLDCTGYLKYLSSIEGPRGPRFSNVARFYRIATSYEEAHPEAGLEKFLSYMDTAIVGDTSAVTADPTVDAVQIMTVHQAKGLEFPVVFVVNLGRDSFPLKFRANRFGYDEEFGLFARTISEDISGARYKGDNGIDIESSLKGKHYGEEKRVMYVAMTRARDYLYLTTCAVIKETKGKKKPAEGSIDFFEHIEKFASETGSRCAEKAVSIPVSTGPPSPQPMTATTMDVESIKRLAAEVLARISQPPSARVASEAQVVTLSYSGLALYRQCPMKYALRYVYNLPLSPHDESPRDELSDEMHPHGGADAISLGNLLHNVLMQYHRRRKADPRADASVILNELARASDCAKEVVRAAQAMMKKYMAGMLSKADTLFEEKEFHWRVSEDSLQILFVGKIDRVHREGDSLKIVDYKTGIADEGGHRLQLGIYRMAMESVFGEKDILTSDYYLSTGEEKEQRFTVEELGEIRKGFLEDARRIAAGDFSMDAGGAQEKRECCNCEYETYCPRT